jgi:hypothetical protein
MCRTGTWGTQLLGKDQLSEKTNPLEKTKKEKQKRRSALQPSGAF